MKNFKLKSIIILSGILIFTPQLAFADAGAGAAFLFVFLLLFFQSLFFVPVIFFLLHLKDKKLKTVLAFFFFIPLFISWYSCATITLPDDVEPVSYILKKTFIWTILTYIPSVLVYLIVRLTGFLNKLITGK